MGLYQLVLAVYSLFVTVATAGVSAASTRLMAEELAGKPARARGMLARLCAAALALGLAAMAGQWCLAPLAAFTEYPMSRSEFGEMMSTLLNNVWPENILFFSTDLNGIGQAIRDMLDDLDCPHELLELSGGGQSRINVKFRGTASQPETAVNGRGPGLGEADLARLLARLEDLGPEDALVISGWAQSIPFYVSLLERANAAGCLTVLDCTGEALWQCLKCRPFLIKPNLSELGALFGVDDLDYLEGVELAAQVQREGARNVLVSMGPGGAFLLTEDQRLYLAPACGGQARSTVGAGDALVAGFLTGLRQTEDFVQALQLRVAAGCAAAFSDWLPAGEEIRDMVDKIRVESVRF